MIHRSIDALAALVMPGVVTFLTAEDVPGQNRRLWFGNVEELFAEEEVHLHNRFGNYFKKTQIKIKTSVSFFYYMM